MECCLSCPAVRALPCFQLLPAGPEQERQAQVFGDPQDVDPALGLRDPLRAGERGRLGGPRAGGGRVGPGTAHGQRRAHRGGQVEPGKW